MPKTMMTIMMMIMTDPFATNLVVKRPVVKGSVVKGATSVMMMMVMMMMMMMVMMMVMMRHNQTSLPHRLVCSRRTWPTHQPLPSATHGIAIHWIGIHCCGIWDTLRHIYSSDDDNDQWPPSLRCDAFKKEKNSDILDHRILWSIYRMRSARTALESAREVPRLTTWLVWNAFLFPSIALSNKQVSAR